MPRDRLRLEFVLLLLAASLAIGACKKSSEVRKELEERKLEFLKEETPELFDPEAPIPETPEVFVAWVRTTKGACWIEVHRDWAPRAADRFYRLIRSTYFTTIPVYRAIPGRLVQWGIHLRPEISELWRRRTCEPDPILKSNLEGYAGFAPDPATENGYSTQIYVNLADNFHLDQDGFVPFGRVIKGLERMKLLYADYGEIAQYGNEAGPDLELAWTQGIRYLKKNFPKLDMVKSIVLKRPAGEDGEEPDEER